MRVDERKRIERPVIKFADDNGVLHLKMNLQGRRGWPDDWFFFDARTAGGALIIEFKAPGELPEPLQAHTIRQLLRRGYDVHVVDSVEEGKRLIRERLGMETKKGPARGRQIHADESGGHNLG